MATSAARALSYEEIKDKVKPAPEFGEGWTVVEVTRRGGKQAGQIDRYWFSPKERFKIRSKAEFGRFQVALEAAPRNDEELAWAIMKGKPPPGSSGGGGGGATSSATVSGPDAGAGHPSAKPADARTSSTKKKQKIQTSRKAQGKGVPLPRGYIPNITSVRGAAPDGPYIDEDEVTRVYNYPKNLARKVALEEKGFYEPELAGADGDDDDGEADGAPYRHITNWFLAKPSATGNGAHRMALPADYRKVKTLCLYGELLPSPRKVQRAQAKGRDPPKSQPVVLRRLVLWSVDRDYNDRGIWFQTNDAWYKLEQPCTARVYNGRSQDDLHLELRAKFGLVSNLLDMLTEKSKSLNLDNFFGLHDSRTPCESHSVLTPKPEQLERYPNLPTEPFDLELLQREATFVKQHIQDCGVDFAKSNFVEGLTEIEREWKKTHKDKKKMGGKKEEGEFDYLASAEAAEKRSGRKPWGCLIYRGGSNDDDEMPRINRLVEIKVEESRSPEMKKTPAKKTKHSSPSSADQPPAKKKKVESSKKAAAAKGRAASPAPASVTKMAKKKKAQLGGMPEAKASVKGGSGSKGRGEIERASKAPTASEKVKAATAMRASASGPADSKKMIRASPTTTATTDAVPTAPTGSGRKRALSDSDDSIFSNSSEEDEWKPTGAAADSKSKASVGKRSDAEKVEEPFSIQDTELHPILIFQVKNKCANKIRAFIDSAGKVVDTRADAFSKSCILPNTVSSYEFMLAVVESLKISHTSVLESLFDRKNPKKCGARRIFVTWLDAAKERMEQRRKDPIQKAILDAVGDNAKTEEELASHILKLSRNCFDPSKATSVMTPQQAMKSFNIDVMEITRKFKSFAEEIGATKLATVCTAHIEVFKAANRASASPPDAFGKALAEGGKASPATSSDKTPKSGRTSAAHAFDSVDYKKVGKAAAVMANVKRSNSGESSKSNGSKVSGSKAVKSGSRSLGNALLSELMAAKSSKKKAKAGTSAQSGVAYARSMPVEEGKN